MVLLKFFKDFFYTYFYVKNLTSHGAPTFLPEDNDLKKLKSTLCEDAPTQVTAYLAANCF